MHLASLTSTPVVSVWGPTHPFLGFSPLFNDEYIVQLNEEELPCRPCSVYGKIRNKDKFLIKFSALLYFLMFSISFDLLMFKGL